MADGRFVPGDEEVVFQSPRPVTHVTDGFPFAATVLREVEQKLRSLAEL